MTQEQFPMVHPLTFIQNPLIQHLSNDPYWTVSDNNKRPVNAKILLEDGMVYNAKFDGESPLVTLHALDANMNLQAVNRAYRLRARENRVIAIDVEPSAPEEMKQEVLNFPAHYTELSKNGGVHLLILVPEDLVNDENRYMFDDLSVFKEPVPKDPDTGKALRGAHYEVLFNDHFVTFTKKMLTQKLCVDYTQDPQAKTQLAGFLQNITNLDKQRKKERELAKQYKINLKQNLITPEKQADIQAFISMKPFEDVREQAENKDVSDFAGDWSSYEMSVANGIAFHVIKYHKMAGDTQSFRALARSLTEQDLVHAIYIMLEEIVPYRDKHEEDRDGLPWLLYTARRAFEYVKAQNAKRQKQK